MSERSGKTERDGIDELEDSGVRLAPRGRVFLVGAGPGDPELLTLRAHRLLSN
ncbi:MAG: hypothetical protein QOI41_7027, partial [Myxococcales bacterium]|nr:hypothetical protein [Myxococcales bacterium]